MTTLEEATLTTTQVYRVYIKATPEAIWDAITKPEWTERYGYAADTDDLLLVTTKGKMIRMHAADVTSQGRNTMGVRIIDLDPDDQVGSLARVEAEQTPAPAP